MTLKVNSIKWPTEGWEMFNRKGEHPRRGFQLDLGVKAWKDEPVLLQVCSSPSCNT